MGRAALTELAHLPQRPAWNCRLCGEPWPCTQCRAELRLNHGSDRAWLGMYLSLYLVDALSDLKDTAPGETYTRFLGWLRNDEPGVVPGGLPRTTAHREPWRQE